MREFYSDLKVLHFDSKLKDIANGILSSPIHIRLKPTNKCNHKCYYCCYRNKKLPLSQLFNKNDEIPRSKMIEIVADLKRMGVKAVTFSGGGEPLYYPYITEAIDKLLQAGIKIAILTNGSLLEGKIAEIVSQRVKWVRISVDAADAKMYSRIRGLSFNEFDKVCRNIYNFAKTKNRKSQLGINFIVTEGNYKDVYKSLKLMKELGVDHVKVSELVMSVKRDENKKYHSFFSKSVKEQITKGIAELADNNFAVIDKFNNFQDNDDCYNKKYTRCPFIQCLVVIGADMNVYACQDKAYTREGKIGSIRGKSFQEVWFSDKTEDKLQHLNPSKKCIHHCSQHNKNIVLFNYLNIDGEHLEFV